MLEDGTAAVDKNSETMGRSDSSVCRMRRDEGDDGDIDTGRSCFPFLQVSGVCLEEVDALTDSSCRCQNVGAREAAVCSRIPRRKRRRIKTMVVVGQ